MKIIFLDIDGVLNCRDTFRQQQTSRPISAEMMARLNRITESTNAKIVISSTWRFHTDINEVLQAAGLQADIVGSTPKNCPTGFTRGQEIEAWLSETKLTLESFVILDDDNSIHQIDRFVQTNMETGLQDEHVEKAVAILSVKL